MIKVVLNRADYIILISTFLPYLIVDEGIRIEHFAVYFIFLLLLFKGQLFTTRKKSFTSITFLFFTIFILVSLGSFLNTDIGNLTFLSNFENYLETLILFLILNCLFIKKRLFTIERMVKINTLFQFLLALNTCLIFIEVFTPFAEIFQKFYVKIDQDGYRVATNSMGRYMGVFNQPLESGFAYSLGLLTWLYNFTKIKTGSKIIQGILLVSIILGGIASISKVFLIGGIGLFTVMFLLVGSLRNRIVLVISILMFLSFIVPIFINDWKGLDILEDQFSNITGEFSVSKVTAGRIGKEDGIYSILMSKDSSIFFLGKGFTLGDLPFFDSEYVQIVYQGGGIALILYFAIFIKLFKKCFVINRKLFSEQILLYAVLLLALFTAFGGPVFLMNRVRVFFFIQLLFLYQLSIMRLKNSSRTKVRI